MPFTRFDLGLWAASFIGHLILLGVLLSKNRYKEFPAFTAFIVFSVVRTLILFPLRNSPGYFNAYWALEGVAESLGFAIIFEGASIIFRPAGRWAPDVKTALWITVAASLAVAAALTYIAAPATIVPVQVVILKGKFLVSTLMAELFVGMIALSARVGLPWRYHVVHICRGLGVYAAFCVVADTALTFYGIRNGSELYSAVSHVRIILYLSCLTYWIVMLWRKEPLKPPMPPNLRKQLGALQEKLEQDLVRIQTWK